MFISSANSNHFKFTFAIWIPFISLFLFFLFIFIYFYFFVSSLIVVTRTSNTMLNKSGESGHPCLVHIYVIIISCWSKFKYILTTLHFLPITMFKILASYFTTFCFVYPLTSYCIYRWFDNFYLLTFLLAWSITFTVYLPLLIRFYLLCFMFLFFLLGKVPLAFILKLVCWCWTLLYSACLWNF